MLHFQQNIPPTSSLYSCSWNFQFRHQHISKLLIEHCTLPENEGQRKDEVNKSGMLFQVHWSKRSPISWRFNHVAKSTGPGVNFVANDGGEG